MNIHKDAAKDTLKQIMYLIAFCSIGYGIMYSFMHYTKIVIIISISLLAVGATIEQYKKNIKERDKK